MTEGNDGLYVREALPRNDFGMNVQGRLDLYGFEGLRDGDLLMLALGLSEEKTRQILDPFPLQELFSLDFSELKRILGKARARRLLSAVELTRRALQKGIGVLPIISCPADILPLAADIKDAKKENFMGLYLNARNQCVLREIISVGSLSSSLVHPREFYVPAIENRAASCIAVHNHPSNCIDPSKDDLDITRRLKQCGELLGVELLDHVVISSSDFLSMKEKGLM